MGLAVDSNVVQVDDDETVADEEEEIEIEGSYKSDYEGRNCAICNYELVSSNPGLGRRTIVESQYCKCLKYHERCYKRHMNFMIKTDDQLLPLCPCKCGELLSCYPAITLVNGVLE